MNFDYEKKYLNENELEWILIFWGLDSWLQLLMFTTKSALILRFGLLSCQKRQGGHIFLSK